LGMQQTPLPASTPSSATLGQFRPTDRIDDPILIAGVQGNFYGAALPAAQIEALIAAHVPKKEISEIADVYGTKWWDYRRLTPGHSFYLFTHHYYRSSRLAAKRMVSERPRDSFNGADKKKAMSIFGPALVQMEVADVWERDKAHITGLWKAMLVADALGMPYDQFCRLSCRVAIDRLWKRLPRPSQLYSDKLAAFVLDEWEELQEARLLTASHPLYLTENYAGLQVQDDYRLWLIDQIKKQDAPVVPLMTAVYARPQLPEAMALQVFPTQAVTRARLMHT
jgi:hypothetical protein